MLQVPCYSPPVYGHSHYKKFWLRQTETEDEAPLCQQHVSNCPQKLSSLASSPLSTMVGTSPAQSPPCCNASLVACASSFGAPSSVSATEAFGNQCKGMLVYDLNQFEDSSEAGAVDCTLSLGTSKRERAEIPTGLSRSGSPACDVTCSTSLPKSAWQPVQLDQQSMFLRDCPTDCIRDIFPQTSLLSRQATLDKSLQDVLVSGRQAIEGSQVSNPVDAGAGSDDTSNGPQKSGFYAAEGGENPRSPAFASDGCHQVLPRAATGKAWKHTLHSPHVCVVDSKAGEAPFAASGLASCVSGQSSGNGDEPRFLHRPTIPELIACAVNASVSRSVARTCAHCGTMKTPLWRNGPQGPKSLCNACGIRFKKAGRRNVNNVCTSDQPLSPQSSKPSPSKTLKRKLEVCGGVSRQFWPVSEDTEGSKGLAVIPTWKRCRHSDVLDSSASEGEETAGSSGTSCVTWQPRSSIALCNPPHASVPALTVVRTAPVAGFLSVADPLCAGEDNSKFDIAGRLPLMKTIGKDEQEGAELLMALSCGVVNA